MSDAQSGAPIRRLTPDDIPGCVALAVDRGWPAEPRRWALLLDIAEGWGITAPDGSLIAAVVLTRHGRVGAVGMMLVSSAHERRGLGRRLMEHLLCAARELDSVFLYATPAGRPLYERLGFRAVHEVATHRGRFSPGPQAHGVETVPLPPDAVGELRAVDLPVLGFDRARLLMALPDFAESVRVVRDPRHGHVVAYAAAWANAGRLAIGPVLAPDLPTARALVTDLAAGESRPIRLECPLGTGTTLRDWAVARGLVEADRCTVMVRGRDLPTDTARMVAPFMQTVG
ncbi:GNAT family N-acetyltransferase [Streptomyces sp. NPDC087440]|uniref:GNAT family N-acetyltransferase n=1 Tax=Streptomyces sp. NPDC087440 TaxID=3365790 RepID=UPI0037FA0B47